MNTATDTSPETLRAAMVDRVRQAGYARTLAVEQAMRTVPRHRFLPHASEQDAYADLAVITKTAGDGAALSCASVPAVVAMMLDQLDVRPGQRVPEIGAGTGYNAALLHHLTGPTGRVVTVDIDQQVTAQARQALDAAGHPDVTVLTRDGAEGAAEHAPYDRVIFTVGAWDLPAAAVGQLGTGGRLVVPLRWRGQTRSIAFVNDDAVRLRSDSVELCGFVPMLGQDGERTGHLDLDGQVTLTWDLDQPVDPATLHGVLDRDRIVVGSGVTVGPTDSFDGVWLRLTATEPTTCRLSATPAAVAARLCTPAIPSRSPALLGDGSLAYLALAYLALGPRAPGGRELVAIAHGPHGADLADRLVGQIRAWNHDRQAHPVITAYPATTTPLASVAARKNEAILTITYGRVPQGGVSVGSGLSTDEATR